MDDRKQPFERHPPGGRHHVLFGDPALDEAIRQLRLERFDASI